MESKICGKCKQEKPRAAFSKASREYDGLQGTCKDCEREYREAHKETINARRKAYRIENKDKIAAQNKDYYDRERESLAEYDRLRYKDNRERHLSRAKDYYDTHKAARSRYGKAYYIEHKDIIADKVSLRRTSNLSAYNAYQGKRRADKRQATPAWYEEREVTALYAEATAITKATGEVHHVDHIVPLQSKLVCGLHCLANLQVLLGRDNCSKSNSYWPDMP
jgi:phage terminase large subunit-like protein